MRKQQVKPHLNSKMARAFTFVGLTAVFLFSLIHHWQGYLRTANRSSLPWDSAMHFIDGVKLFQTAVTGDVPSFLYHFLSFGFWLPLHPLLVAVTNVFFPFQAGPVVFLNYLLLCSSFSFCVFFLARAIPSPKRDITPFAGGAWLFFIASLLVYRMSSQTTWISLLNSVMLEMAAFSLTLAHLVSASLFLWRRDEGMLKVAVWMLFGLFLTKIHYGILVAPVFFLSLHAMRGNASGINRREAGRWFRLLLRRRYFRVMAGLYALVWIFLCLCLWFRWISGRTDFHFLSLRVSVSSYGNFIWFFLWIPLAIWTVELVKGRNRIHASLPWTMKYLHDCCVFPFAWYYLFPLRHKIGAFLYNLNIKSQEAPLEWLGRAIYYPRSLSQEFLGFEGHWQGFLWVFCVAALLVATWRRQALLPARFLLGNFILFYVVMSFFNDNKEPRMAVTWAAQFVALNLFAGFSAFVELQKRSSVWLNRIFLVFALAGAGMLVQLVNQVSTERVRQVTSEIHLPLDYRGFDFIVENFDPSRPGIIFGLGMDLGNPQLSLRLMQKYRWSSSVFFRKGRPFINDLGREGNRNPVEFIRKKCLEQRMGQIVLFKLSFESREFDDLVRFLLSESGGGLKILRETQDYVYLSI